MKCLVTGSNGFIAKNLVVRLKQEGYDVVTYDVGDELDTNVDFIFHFAGVNRPADDDFSPNWTILEEIMKTATCPIMLSSSIQARLDNPYGKSKKKAEDILKKYKGDFYIYRFTNIFGKWCKPSYNSVVATWCHNISHNEEVVINDKHKLIDLLYIDDLCDEMVNLLKTRESSHMPIETVSLGELYDYILKIKKDIETCSMPDFSNQFYKKLFSTYLSYLDDQPASLTMHKDDRGSFTELFKSSNCGMVSVNVMKPGQTKGNHYHNSKWEYFVVVKGKAKIIEEDIVTGSTKEFLVDDTEFKPIIMIPGYNHKITNLSNEDCIFIIYTNEIYNKDKGDTYYLSGR